MLVGVVDVDADEVLKPGVGVEAGAVLADLDQPRPDDVGRRVDGDRQGRLLVGFGIESSPGRAIWRSAPVEPQFAIHGRTTIQ